MLPSTNSPLLGRPPMLRPPRRHAKRATTLAVVVGCVLLAGLMLLTGHLLFSGPGSGHDATAIIRVTPAGGKGGGGDGKAGAPATPGKGQQAEAGGGKAGTAGEGAAAAAAVPPPQHVPLQLRPRPPGDPEVWARGPAAPSPATKALQALLGDEAVGQLRALCGRCLYRTLTSYVRAHDHGRFTVVLTGDIPAVWLRDSAVQMASYVPRVARRPAMRQALEGAIRAQAFFVLQDPWANAFNPKYMKPESLPKYDRQLGRGGWVWTRNFELDSVAYFFNFLWNFHQNPDVWNPGSLLLEPVVHDAVRVLLQLLRTEQRHEERSPYRYSELPREGLGPPAAYTGMVWSAFRASDDPQKYSYNIPDNMYLWGSLKRLALLNDATWRDADIAAAAAQLMRDVHAGIERHGVVEVEPGLRVYAYEVDGKGGVLADFDDPNLPSLLALPLLGYDVYDKQLYAATRARILSPKNPYYFAGSQLKGLGSPHTSSGFIWPLATAVEALTVADAGGAVGGEGQGQGQAGGSDKGQAGGDKRGAAAAEDKAAATAAADGAADGKAAAAAADGKAAAAAAPATAAGGDKQQQQPPPQQQQQQRQAELLRDLLKMASNNGLAHESVNVNDVNTITRPEFGWANAMTVVAVEQLLGVDCDAAAEEHRVAGIEARERREAKRPANGGEDIVAYYEQLEAAVVHE